MSHTHLLCYVYHLGSVHLSLKGGPRWSRGDGPRILSTSWRISSNGLTDGGYFCCFLKGAGVGLTPPAYHDVKLKMLWRDGQITAYYGSCMVHMIWAIGLMQSLLRFYNHGGDLESATAIDAGVVDHKSIWPSFLSRWIAWHIFLSFTTVVWSLSFFQPFTFELLRLPNFVPSFTGQL